MFTKRIGISLAYSSFGFKLGVFLYSGNMGELAAIRTANGAVF